MLHRLTRRPHRLAQHIADLDAIPLLCRAHAVGRRVLTQYIGVKESESEPDIHRMALEDGDRLLLCTDGLTDMVDDDAIADILKDGDSNQACRALVDQAAWSRGGPG